MFTFLMILIALLAVAYIIGCIAVSVKEYRETKSFFNALCAIILSIILTPIFAPKMIRETRP